MPAAIYPQHEGWRDAIREEIQRKEKAAADRTQHTQHIESMKAARDANLIAWIALAVAVLSFLLSLRK